MPDEKSVTNDQKPKRCASLLSKGMFINFGLSDEERCSGDGTIWCGETQGTYGPDGQLCGAEECTDSTRSCYEAC